MKKIVLLVFLILLNFSCASHRNFFNDGNVTIPDGVEEIRIDITKDIPLCKVQIGGKEYTFMVDTGAPTIISEGIFESLNIKESHAQNATDSQDKEQKLKFAKLPEMRIGNMIFKDIGCAILNLDSNGFECFGIDGIVGANLMAKLVLEFDYANRMIKASAKQTSFDVEKSDFIWNFTTTPQKTPKISGQLLEKNLSFTFDTGFSGNIDVPNNYEFYKSKIDPKNFITESGSSSIGVFGLGKPATNFSLKTGIAFDSIPFPGEIIGSGSSSLIGNSFLKDYVFVMDWQARKIYFKRNVLIKEKSISGFGFSYLFIDGKPTVLSKVEHENVPINLGDEILSINDFDFTKIDNTDICKYWLNKVENGLDQIDVKVKRNNEILSFNLEKTKFIK